MAIFVGLALRLPAWDDFPAELQRLAAVERTTPPLANPLLNPPGTPAARAAAAEEISGRILPQWDAERQRFAALRLPYQQRGIAEKFGKYVSLRVDGMTLLARALQDYDEKSLADARADQRAANGVMVSMIKDLAGAVRQKKP
jgi:hypothetical protein